MRFLGALAAAAAARLSHAGLAISIVFLRAQVYEGARERWGVDLTDEQRDQIDHELRVIAKLGFAGFFLVMWDAVRFARSRNILCQGRGSAANSAVAYCLQVTAVDPVQARIAVRALSLRGARAGPGRREPRRPTSTWTSSTTGARKCSTTCTTSTERGHAAITCIVQMYRAPNAMLDAMRALGYPPELGVRDLQAGAQARSGRRRGDSSQRSLAERFGVDLTTARGRALLIAMRSFEGVPRLRSTHVGGFVLSSAPLGDYLPIEQTTMGRTIMQFDKDDLDMIGVPKFDFLGLGALACVRHAFDAIERDTGTRPEMYSAADRDRRRTSSSRAARRSARFRSRAARRSRRFCTRVPSICTTSSCRSR